MKERYKACTSCGTIHLVHHTFKDKRPTCYKCGRSSFEDSKRPPKEKYTPIFCDWELQNNIEESATDLVNYLLERNSFELKPELKEDFKQYFIFAANTNRKGFATSMNSFKNYIGGKND